MTDHCGALPEGPVSAPPPWWKTAVVYQIYPRSFAEGSARTGDHAADGVGDLRGIIEHLDHIAWLGADALWLSPIFTSPMADFGYDVSNFCDVDPLFGDLGDLDDLVAEAHRRGIQVILDWVPNHTSIEHPWFQESRRDRTNPKAAWYIWRDTPPNNWNAAFPRGDTAWLLDDTRGQYYLRSFCKEQADLNWDNPDVEAAMLDTLRFWLDRGIDGFRMDVVHMIGKDLTADDPPEAVAKQIPHVPFNDVEVTHERLRRIRSVLDGYPGERASVGEVYLLDEDAMSRYYGDNDELHLSFNFSFLWAEPTPASFRERITTTLAHLERVGGWPTWALSNHDVPRHRQRHGRDERLARITALLLLTLPGTPFLYQGEELGLLDAEIADEAMIDPGRRDGCRAPIPWTAEPNHGWPTSPWLPFAPEAEHRNVATMTNDTTSIAHLYRELVHLRARSPSLQTGSFSWVGSTSRGVEGGGVEDGGSDGEGFSDGEVLAYHRGDEWTVVANFGSASVELDTFGLNLRSVLATGLQPLQGRIVPGFSGVIARRD